MKTVQSSYLHLSIYFLSSRVELLSSAFQFDSSSRVQLFNSTRLEFKNLSIRLDTFRVKYLTRTQVLNLTRSVYQKVIYTYKQLFTLNNVDEKVT